MNEELNSGITLDPTNIYIPMNTEYLVNTYGQYLEGLKSKTKDFYIEKSLPQGQFRSYRYVATLASTIEPRLPIQNLAKLYSSNGDIWTRELGEGDLAQVDEAIALIKVSNDSAKRADSTGKMDRDVELQMVVPSM